MLLKKRKKREFTEDEMIEMKKDYFSMTQTDFCQKWKMSSSRGYTMFGSKPRPPRIKNPIPKFYHKERDDEIKSQIKKREEEVMDKLNIDWYQLRKLLNNYTYTEILEGEMINGKWKPKNLIKVYK